MSADEMTDEQLRVRVGVLALHFANEEEMRADKDIMRHLPNYPRDLNACYEFELGLDPVQSGSYSHNLWVLCETLPLTFRATARQRCIAFIKTKDTQ